MNTQKKELSVHAWQFFLLKHVILKKEGDVLKIGDIIRKNQPEVYKKLIELSRKKHEEKIDFKKMMEDAPVYKRHHGSWKQVRFD